MKHILLILAAASLAFTSCTVFQKNKSVVAGSAATKVETEKPVSASAQAPASAPTPAVSAAASQTEPAATAQPTVTTTAESAAAPVIKTAETAAPTAVNQSKHNLNGEWLMVQVGSQTIDRDEEMPYAIFDAGGRLYAYDGCNTLNGSYSLSAADEFKFSGMMSTRRYCPDEEIQHTIATVFTEEYPVKAVFSEVGTESFVDLLGPSGKSVVRLRRANIDFLNGHWAVVAVNGASISEDAPADVFFDIAERKIHGNTGCNYFNGEIYLDYRQPNAIDFSKMGVTRMACPNTAQETALLVALEETTTALSGGRDSAMLLAADGRELVELRRIPDAE